MDRVGDGSIVFRDGDLALAAQRLQEFLSCHARDCLGTVAGGQLDDAVDVLVYLTGVPSFTQSVPRIFAQHWPFVVSMTVRTGRQSGE